MTRGQSILVWETTTDKKVRQYTIQPPVLLFVVRTIYHADLQLLRHDMSSTYHGQLLQNTAY